MRFLAYMILIIISFLIQTTLFEYISILGVIPNLLLIVVVSFSFMRGDIEGALIGFAIGLLIDSFFANFLGLNAFIYMIIGFLCGKIFNEFYKNGFFIPFLLTLFFSFFHGIMSFFFNVFLKGYPNILPFFYSIILPEVIYTSLISIFVYKILYHINLKLEKSDRKKRNIFK